MVSLSLFNWRHSKILDNVAQMGNLSRAHSVRSINVVIMYLLLEIWDEMKNLLKLKINPRNGDPFPRGHLP